MPMWRATKPPTDVRSTAIASARTAHRRALSVGVHFLRCFLPCCTLEDCVRSLPIFGNFESVLLRPRTKQSSTEFPWNRIFPKALHVDKSYVYQGGRISFCVGGRRGSLNGCLMGSRSIRRDVLGSARLQERTHEQPGCLAYLRPPHPTLAGFVVLKIDRLARCEPRLWRWWFSLRLSLTRRSPRIACLVRPSIRRSGSASFSSRTGRVG